MDLITAIKKNNIEKVKSIIKNNNVIDIDTTSDWNYFNYACDCGNLEIIILLLLIPRNDARIFLNKQDNSGCTPFHYVCIKGYSNIIYLLLNNSIIDHNIQNRYGWTPFHYICYYENIKNIEFLFYDAKINPNKQDGVGWTTFHYVCYNGNITIIKLFLNRIRFINFGLKSIRKWKK